jgi:predicted transcriptional regulator
MFPLRAINQTITNLINDFQQLPSGCNMAELSNEEQRVIDVIQENGGSVAYKDLQDTLANEFEGVRLILKKLKEKGLVDYEGMIPGFSAQIRTF